MKMPVFLTMSACFVALSVLQSSCWIVPMTPEASATAPAIIASISIVAPTSTGGAPTPSPTSLPKETLTPTPASPGQVRKDMLVEVKQAPEIACSRSEIWLISSPYTTAQPLLRHEGVSYRSPRWSRHGTMIAYIVEAGDETHIELRERNSDVPRLSSSPFPYGVIEPACNRLQVFSWSPSNRWLAFEQVNYTGQFSRHLYVLDTSTGQSTLVADAFYGFPPAVWSPKDDTIAYVHATYDASGRRVSSLNIKLAQIENGSVLLRDEIPMPIDFETWGRSDRVRGLVWYTETKLLVVVTPTIGDDSAKLYEVNVTTHAWRQMAEYKRSIDLERYPPSQIHISPDGDLVAWIGDDLLVLDLSSWREVGRMSASWPGEPVVTWTNDSNNHSALVFYDADSFWIYYPELAKRERLFRMDILSPELTSMDIAVAP